MPARISLETPKISRNQAARQTISLSTPEQTSKISMRTPQLAAGVSSVSHERTLALPSPESPKISTRAPSLGSPQLSMISDRAPALRSAEGASLSQRVPHIGSGLSEASQIISAIEGMNVQSQAKQDLSPKGLTLLGTYNPTGRR